VVGLYVSPPCPERAGDVVGVLLEGPSEEGVVTFGQAFRPGDVPGSTGLAARAGGREIPAQLDVLARHPDGSARHGVVSLAAPRLAAGQRLGVMLARGEGAAAPLSPAAGRSAVLELRPLPGGAGGEPWQADLLALWARGAGGRPWQSGPLAAQGRVAVPVPAAAVGGVASLRLLADLTVQADGTLWADVWLRNDIAMRPNGGEAAYAVRLLLDGREVLAAEVPKHPQYMGWGRLRGARPGGRPAPELPLVRHDIAYLETTAAILPYDLTTGVREETLNQMARLAGDPRWGELFHPRGLRQTMGDPGSRSDLGLTTMWQAAWLTSGDRRAARISLDQAEMAANIPWHHWDPAGGADGRGGWLDVRRWPRLWTDIRGGRPPLTLTQPVPPRDQAFGWATIPSHAPDLSYVPYLLTGRRGFLDNLMSQACWNVVTLWPASRHLRVTLWPEAGTPSPEPATDVLVVYTQLRSAAWAMRTLGAGGWVAPEGDPNRDYVRDVEGRNWQWIRRQIPGWTAWQGEAHGYIPYPGLGYADRMAQFSNEYFASVGALAALRGQDDAREVLSWQRNFLVGRFFQQAQGFPRNDAVGYQIGIAPGPPRRQPLPPQPPFKTWREIAEQTRTLGIANGDGWKFSNGEYGRLAMLSLAMVHRTLGDAQALEAYDWVARSGAPFTGVGTFEMMPQHNVAPLPRPRVPARARACRAA